MKNFIFKRSLLYLALLLGFSNAYAINDVKIEDNPLAGLQGQEESPDVSSAAGITYPPNLYLALSVEFPTAAVAYSQDTVFKKEHFNRNFIGYFDNTKCYKFDKTEEAFIPSSLAGTMGTKGYRFKCNNGAETEEFSGNMLNWATMSAIDILRYSLTGGNRAKGVGTADANYTNAESAKNGGVYLRHSNVTSNLRNKYGRYGYGTKVGYDEDNSTVVNPPDFSKERRIDFTDMSDDEIKAIIPHRYIPDVKGVNRGAFYIFHDDRHEEIGTAETLTGRKLVILRFNEFGVQFGREILRADGKKYRLRPASPDGAWAGDKYAANNGQSPYYSYLPVVVNACNNTGSGGMGRDDTKCSIELGFQTRERDSSNTHDPNRVKIITTKKTVSGKPYGLIHKYFGQVNIAAFGYLNSADSNLDGGVLRAPLSDLMKEISSADDSVGSFPKNPYPEHANNDKDITNSGVINYLNKFGDVSGYKTNDPAPELYYEMTRYIRGLSAWGLNKYTGTIDKAAKDGFPYIKFDGNHGEQKPHSIVNISKSRYNTYVLEDIEDESIANAASDPLFASSHMSTWTYNKMRQALLDQAEGKTVSVTDINTGKTETGVDPVVAAFNDLPNIDVQQTYQQAACRVNNILFIGDHETQFGGGVPNEESSSDISNLHTDAKTAGNGVMKVEEYTKAVLKGDKIDSDGGPANQWNSNWGSDGGNNPPVMAGMAYWLRANDNRKDLFGEQRATNFMIDTLEDGCSHINENACVGGGALKNKNITGKMRSFYYLAAKWGGFGLDQKQGLPVSATHNTGLNVKPDDTGAGSFSPRGIGTWKIDTGGFFYVNIADYKECADENNNVVAYDEELDKEGLCYWKDGSQTGDAYNTALQTQQGNIYDSYKSFKLLKDNNSSDINGANVLFHLPYNLAPGNNPEALEKSLEAMFTSSIENAEAANQQRMRGKSYSQAPSATANASGLTLCSSNDENCSVRGTDNTLISAVYDLSTFSGDVTPNKVYTQLGDTTNRPLFDNGLARSIAGKVAASNRELYTKGENGGQIPFTAANANTIGLSEEIINYVNGSSQNRGSLVPIEGEGNYPNYIGTIVNSNILEVPAAGYGEKSRYGNIIQGIGDNQVSCDANTAGRTNANDRYFGVASNDGIYHLMTFNGTRLDEKYAYIPTSTYDKLETYVSQSKHQYINDGTSYHFEFCDNNGDFKSLVVGTTGRGGSGIYAIDVTDTTPTLAWEKSSSDFAGLGLTIPTVESAILADGRAVLIISSGYNAKNATNGYIYIVDATTGNLIENGAITLGTSSVGSPFVYDHDADGVLDAIYVGDFAGNLWKIAYYIDTADNNKGKFFTAEKLFDPALETTVDGNPIIAKPITAAPFASRSGDDVYVIFATGHTLNNGDTGLNKMVQNYAYGIFEQNFKTSLASGSSTMLPDNIAGDVRKPFKDTFAMPLDNDETITAVGSGDNQSATMKYYSQNADTVSGFSRDNHRGWRVVLATGYTATLSQTLQKRLAVFVVTKPREEVEVEKSDNYEECDVCGWIRYKVKSPEQICGQFIEDTSVSNISGTTAIIALDVAKGSQYKGKSIFDTTGDNQIKHLSACESYAGDAKARCEAEADQESSILYIDDLLSTGGGSLTKFFTPEYTDAEGNVIGDKRTNGAILGGYSQTGSGVRLASIAQFGISSFIRNSLREIRR